MTLGSVQIDRVAGSLIGLAAGDALGAGYEFGPPTTEVPEMKGGGPFGWEPGEWTDDTSMAVCIAEVAAAGEVDATKVAARFLDWFGGHPPDVGNQTRAVLAAASGASDVASRAVAYFRAHPKGAAGNGSLMRTGPVALAHLGHDAALAAAAREVSQLTHADPIAGDACVLWCVAIDRAVRAGRLDGIHDGIGLLPADRQEFWKARIGEAELELPRKFARNGYVVTALQAAHASVFHTPIPADMPCLHLQYALHRAVQIGDDTDTVAAITGALLGARWGLTAIPTRWVTMLHGWPGLHAADLARLAVLSARGGASDGAGWPSGSSLLQYYSTHYRPDPVIVALSDDPGVQIGNVAALPSLAAEPPDVVVSLCRIGTSDLPPGTEGCQLMLIDQPGDEHNPNLDFMLHDIAGQIVAWRPAGKTVFVHCVMSESRTPTVAAAYLAERLGIGGTEALERIRATLPLAHPNAGFVDSLERIWPEAARD
ncbi:MAG: ADP-ribosylglycohydrolase family protein [Acidimicrobiales bacterium]